MIGNYLRIAYRNLLKNKAFSFINIFGLGVGIATFLLIVHNIRFEFSYEDFHEKADNIYRITLDDYNGSEYVSTDCETHALMGPMIKEKMPEVIDFVRMFHNDGFQDIKANNEKFLDEGIYFADPSVFDIFTLDVIHGNQQGALDDPFQAVITSSAAKKYFGRENAVGESIEIDKHRYNISAIIADLPTNTHLKYSILLSHSTLLKTEAGWYSEDNWNANNEYTYLLMQPGIDLAAFNSKLAAMCAGLKDKLGNDRYVAESIKDIHLYSHKTYEPEANGNAKSVYFLLIIASFILFIAWVNYVNLSTARAIERAREVGIRKVMGSMKVQLLVQFLSESVILNALAGVLALVLFQSSLPFFRELTGQPLPPVDKEYGYLFTGLVLAGSLLSGIYPAFVLSSFQPAMVLKGKFKSSSHGQFLRKGLVIFQFGSTAVLLICLITVYQQVMYLRHYDLGMKIDQTLVVRAPRIDGPNSVFRSGFESLKTTLLQNPDVKLVARSESVPGLSLHELSSTELTQVGNQNGDGEYVYYYFWIDADFISTMGMSLVAGRNFESAMPNNDEVIINEEAVQKLGFSSPQDALGSKLTFYTRWPDGQPATIIGVVKNFYQRSPKEHHLPMLFKYWDGAGYFSIRLSTRDLPHAMAAVRSAWDRVFPDNVFSYFFLDERFDQQYAADVKFGEVIAAFSLLAVFIACLGLFGLSSYTIVQRTKEIGIRKVLGASVRQIVQLLSLDFVSVVMIASLIALPVAYFAMEEWLSGYANRIHLNGWLFLLPVVLVLFIAMATVSFQTLKTALTNPVSSLKQE
jgi:putative ABC transport system permease protein